MDKARNNIKYLRTILAEMEEVTILRDTLNGESATITFEQAFELFEMGYDADVPPCLRLLPIETRLQPQALMEWRMVPEQWTRIDLDVNDPKQLSAARVKFRWLARASR